MVRLFGPGGQWFAKTVAGGIVEGFAFVTVVSIGLSLWSWLKGATFQQAALLGLFAIVFLALALYLVSLAVVKFHERPVPIDDDNTGAARDPVQTIDLAIHKRTVDKLNECQSLLNYWKGEA